MTDTSPAADWPVMSIAEAHARLTAPGAPFEIEEKVIRAWPRAPGRTLRRPCATCSPTAAGSTTASSWSTTTSAPPTTLRQGHAHLAHRLLADGVKKGDRVAVIMRNLPEWPVCFWAGVLVGAIVTPLNAWWTGPELEYGLADSGTKVAFVDEERLDRVASSWASCPTSSGSTSPACRPRDLPPKASRLEDVIGLVNGWGGLPELPMPDVDLGPEDDATILYTSGTTGPAQGRAGHPP
jgi:long-chain acyl-CoA synthetase